MGTPRRVLVAATFFLLIPPFLCAAQSEKEEKEILVGCHYFAGWWEEKPNKYFAGGRDWRKDFPGRVPLLGEYNDQATIDREIKAAAKYGVDFFQILWYPPGVKGAREDLLNRGVTNFLRSRESRRMKFVIEYCNHTPFQITDDRQWKETCRMWCKAMQHPAYLRVGGRPVFKIHSQHHFREQNGKDPAKVAARIRELRDIAKSMKLPDPLVGGGVYPEGVPAGEDAAPYDYFTCYMYVPELPKGNVHPYSALLDPSEKYWTFYAERSEKPFVPWAPAGWDPRPWGDPRTSFEMPTRKEWTDALRRVKKTLEENDKLGFPLGEGRTQKAFVIYCWNEFGEGGIVAPTKGEGTMKLEAIREVFR